MGRGPQEPQAQLCLQVTDKGWVGSRPSRPRNRVGTSTSALSALTQLMGVHMQTTLVTPGIVSSV